MKKFTLFMLLAISIGALQAQTSPDYIFGTDNGAGWNWTTGTQGTASLGSSYKWQFAATATADHFFKFGETASNGDGSGFWVNGSSDDMNYTGGGAKWTAYYKANMGDGGAIKTAITSGNYYVVKARKQAGNDIDFAVFDNGASAPVTIGSVTRTISSNDLTVTATASAAAGANEKIWLRYSKDNWSTSTTTEMTFTSGTSYAATLNLTSGDFVSYYVLTTINQTAAPAEADVDFFTVNYNNNSGKNYTVQIGPFSGNYYIPQGTNAKGFDLLSTAVNNINTTGVGGDVVFYITSDITENNDIWLGVNTNSYKVIIKPASSVTPTITFTKGTNVGAGTSIDGCFVIGSPTGDNTSLVPTNNVIIDGSNTVGGVSKDLTFIGATTTTTVTKSLLRIYGNNDDITIKNCIMIGKCTSGSNNGAIHVTNYNSTNLAPDRLIIDNNTLTNVNGNGAASIHISNSGSPTIGLTGLVIRNNVVNGRVRGMFISYTNDGDIYGNTISEVSQTDQGSAAITLQTNFATAGTFNVYNNKITTLTTINKTAGANNGVVGIDNQCQAPKIVNIYNNMITGMGPGNASTTNSKIYGIRVTSTGISNVYNNTIVFPDMTDMTTFGSSYIAAIAFATAAATEASPTGTINIKNNILVSNETGTTMKVWGIRRVGTGGTFNSDYNNFYSKIPNSPNNFAGFYNTLDEPGLSDWQTASSQDTHSKSKAVNFVSATDLSLTGASIDDMDLAVPAIGGPVTTDIFGNARHTPNVYMGAHEPTNLNDAQTFTVTVPQGTEHVYIAGTFLGKNWDLTNPFELTATANPNEFSGTFPAHSDIAYKYLCNKGDWDYQEAVTINPLTAASNHTYNANDVVAYWYAMPKVKLNVSINHGVPDNLYVKGGWDNWTTPIALTPSSTPLSAPEQRANSESNATLSFTGVIGNGTTDKILANTEYKYYTTTMADPNWESNADGSASYNRLIWYPLMNDEIARFTTDIATGLGTTKEVEVVIIRTPSGIAVTFDGTATVELYNMKGSLIEKTTATGKYSRDLESGAYIIRINGKATKFVR